MPWSEREKRLTVIILILGLALVSLLVYMLFGQRHEAFLPLSPYSLEEADALLEGEIKAPIQAAQAGISGKQEPAEPQMLMVDVKGAVARPGVYQLESGARVTDAIEKAGGILEAASTDAINLAEPLSDGMAIRVPLKAEAPVPLVQGVSASTTVTGSGSTGGEVNINTAQAEELETLPGIGPAKAAAIIQFREENGPFQDVNQLTDVPGIGEKTLQNIQEQITVK